MIPVIKRFARLDRIQAATEAVFVAHMYMNGLVLGLKVESVQVRNKFAAVGVVKRLQYWPPSSFFLFTEEQVNLNVNRCDYDA